MPLFSIPVSELTPELLAKAEYWKIVGVSDLGGRWADTRPPYALIATGEPDYPLYLSEGSRHYHKNLRCFPVSISPDGAETRLECPRMPDEVEIDWYPKPSPGVQYNAIGAAQTPHGAKHWRLEGQTIPFTSTATQMAPTSEHSPRLTLEGEWVWSTRR